MFLYNRTFEFCRLCVFCDHGHKIDRIQKYGYIKAHKKKYLCEFVEGEVNSLIDDK